MSKTPVHNLLVCPIFLITACYLTCTCPLVVFISNLVKFTMESEKVKCLTILYKDKVKGFNIDYDLFGI